MTGYLIPTYTSGHYLTPNTRKIAPHPGGGYAILGFVGEVDPHIRTEMTYWAPTLREVEEYAREHAL